MRADDIRPYTPALTGCGRGGNLPPAEKGEHLMIYLPPPEGVSGALRDWLERLTQELDRLEERVAELEAKS